MLKKFGELLFFLVLIWGFWVLVLGGSPQERMDRACTMISGPGNLLASMANSLNNDWGGGIQHGTVDATYRCRLTLWNFFYAKDWAAAHPGQPLPGTASAPSYTPLVVPQEIPAKAPPPAAPSNPPATPAQK